MPTQSTTYNSRVTDEALEKRFRDTFRSQGGSELVDDLYASGVIVPIVDFTSTVGGSSLSESLQTAWDVTTGYQQIVSASPQTIINNAGFWQIDLTYSGFTANSGGTRFDAFVNIFDGTTQRPIWAYSNQINSVATLNSVLESKFVVFLRSNDSLTGEAQSTSAVLNVWYRQIATVSGDLINPSGFTAS